MDETDQRPPLVVGDALLEVLRVLPDKSTLHLRHSLPENVFREADKLP